MAKTLVFGWRDIAGFEKFRKAIQDVNSDLKKVATRALNRTGDSARVQIRRALTKQTGLKQKTLQKALKTNKATESGLSYEIYAKGGDISLKYFSPRETRKGVSAAPFRNRHIFERTFMFGGVFPNRHGEVGNGHVFIRDGRKPGSMSIVKSGVFIPKEMIKDQSRAAFKAAVNEVLPKRIEHELKRFGL